MAARGADYRRAVSAFVGVEKSLEYSGADWKRALGTMGSGHGKNGVDFRAVLAEATGVPIGNWKRGVMTASGKGSWKEGLAVIGDWF